MRQRLGRPDMTRYTDRFTVPAAAADAPLSVTFLGVSSLLFSDGRSAFMTDGYFSRPGLLAVARGRIRPDERRIDAVLQRTGAVLVGGGSAANIGRGHGLADHRIHVVTPGEPASFGTYELTSLVSEHCPPDRFPGSITTPVPRDAPTKAYRCGEAWSLHVRHVLSGRTALVQGSAGYVRGALPTVFRREDPWLR